MLLENQVPLAVLHSVSCGWSPGRASVQANQADVKQVSPEGGNPWNYSHYYPQKPD